MSNYVPTIGLEIHAELKTRTKMFCDSLNDPDEKHPNVNVCPVCLGHPGTLPTINKCAVEHIVRIGLSLGGKINPVAKFDRKNYFYPDLPKSYQISQYDTPIVVGGELNGVRITRVHLEEDAGRLAHVVSREGDKNEGATATLVDFNRAGVPLMELVTEPDIESAEEAGRFARELQLILRYLGVSDADMEKGQMRLEGNVSLGKMVDGKFQFGTKVEVKNINSFRALEAAIEYELARQKEVLDAGEKVKQETRGWDDVKKKTVSQRSKEEAHDYRYFPEPDLPPFETSVFAIENLRETLPEMPKEKHARFKKEYGLDDRQAELLIGDRRLGEYYEEAVSEIGERESGKKNQLSMLVYNYLVSDLLGIMNTEGISWDELKIAPEHLAHLMALLDEGKIASRQAKDILRKMFETGLDPDAILESENLHLVSDEAQLKKTIEEIIKEFPAAVSDYQKGKEASLQFLIGKAMSKLKGRGNPELLRELLKRRL